MKIFSAGVGVGVGVGLGVKDFRGIFVFDNKTVFDRFVEQGWTVQGQADTAATLAIEVALGIHLYQITKNGLAAQATIQGTKFWKDDELN
jgi:lipid-binding SYLF domain-containing protein